ncbi:MAG TPA: amino acid ABC transporter permease [Bacillota bacterium]|mgnify:CR=1 FL=1|nr:amino acid ABC transporter permease [Bacillota bacterium]HOA15639.1 amino acid ABC transporter permease [Bacillota bacterium]HOG53599.1 amino acid ABC transporter permease [Bacillota bacterium]
MLDFSFIPRILPSLLEGAGVTLWLTAAAVGIGFFIGSFVGIIAAGVNKPLGILARSYINIIRGTPLLVQIFLIYFGIPALMGSSIPSVVAAVAALGINSGAYIGEIVRGGIISVDKGQYEASFSLGMNRNLTMLHVIFPQAFKRIVPMLGNEFIAMLKDSSLVAVISMEELLRKGQLQVTRTFRPFEIYIVISLMYLVMTYCISLLVKWSERRLATDDR